MGNEISPNPDRRSFEQLRKVNQHGAEYWSARDLQPLLGYSQWRRFEEAVQRAITSCKQSGNDPTYHFADAGKMVALGSGSEREIPDFHLSRFACYLIAQNGDPRKPAIADAQKYFAVQTRRQELSDAHAVDIERIELREHAKHEFKALSGAAQDAGVQSRMFGVFHDAGYQGRYGGLGAEAIKRRKNIPAKENLMDRMDTTELAANQFRMTQARDKLKREGVRGEQCTAREIQDPRSAIMQAMARLRTYTAAISILLATTTLAEMPEPNIEPTVRISRGKVEVPKDPGLGAVVRGRITDDTGSPLERARVGTVIYYPSVSFITSFYTYTDAEGHYALPLPWSGYAYDISVGGTTYFRESSRIEAVPDQNIDFVLGRKPTVERPVLQMHKFNGVVRDGVTGDVVAGAEVSRLGREGRGRYTTTDETGSFSFPPEDHYSRESAVARHGGKVSAAVSPEWERDTFAELVIGPPGGLAGTVYFKGSKTPAAGCSVALTNGPKQFEVLFATHTDAGGNYRFENIPPDTYYVHAQLPYPDGDRHRFDSRDDKVKIEAGRTERLDHYVEKLVRIAGRVIGPDGGPASFALVQSNGSPRAQFQTDKEGRFSESIPAEEKRVLYACSPRYGYGEFELSDLRPGLLKRGIEIRLNGMARLRGNLHGPDGEPVSDVLLLNTLSKDSGAFDAGWIPIPSDSKGIELDLQLPRPYSGISVGIDEAQRKKNDEKNVFYYSSPFQVAAAHGEDISMDVSLIRAPIRTLTGKVVGPDGMPASGTDVLVYAGTPTTAQWFKDIAPPEASGAQGGFGGGNPTLAARTKTDDLGKWVIRMIPELYRRERDYGFGQYDVNNLTIFAASSGLKLTAMHIEKVESGEPVELKIKMKLRPAPPDLVAKAKVVAPDGNPIGGATWVINYAHTVVSDKDGLLTIPRYSEQAILRLTSNAYEVVGVTTEVSSAGNRPKPASVPYVQGFASGYGGFGGNGGFAGQQPALQVNGNTITFDFAAHQSVDIKIALRPRQSEEAARP